MAIMYTNLEKIGRQIRAKRKEKGWTQAYLAELSGIDRTSVGLIERGSYTDIGIRKVDRVLGLLGYKFSLTTQFLPTLDDLVAEQAEEKINRPKRPLDRKAL